MLSEGVRRSGLDRLSPFRTVSAMQGIHLFDPHAKTVIDLESFVEQDHLYFRIKLVAYLYGISSERQLCKDVYYNLACRWFTKTIDADSRVILDTEVTTGARHDNQPYLDQLQRIRDQYKITIREAIADRGYGSAAIIRALQTQGIPDLSPALERPRRQQQVPEVRIDL